MSENENELPSGPRISVHWTKAATKDGNEGWSIRVTEGADEAEASRLMALAHSLREEALGWPKFVSIGS